MNPQKGESSNQSSKAQKLKRIRTSFLNILYSHRPTGPMHTKSMPHNQQEEARFQQHSSIHTSTDMGRILTNKNVAFTTAEIEAVYELDENYLNNPRKSKISDDIESEYDIINVIPDKETTDDALAVSTKNNEPYPFRSEIPLSPTKQQDSLTNNTKESPRGSSQKNIFYRLFHRHHHHKKKKNSRFNQTTLETITEINRSISTPNIKIKSTPSVNSVSKTTGKEKKGPSKTIRSWFKSLPFHPFSKSTQKHTDVKSSLSPHKRQIPRRSIGLRRLSELLY